MSSRNIYQVGLLACIISVSVSGLTPACAEGPLRELLKRRMEQHQQQSQGDGTRQGFGGGRQDQTPQDGLYEEGANYQGKVTNDSFDGRDMAVYVPSRLPAAGQRALIVVLHGGFGNAKQIESYLGLDPLADQYGFVVAYLNGLQVAGIGGADNRGWNAGDCCGQPQKKNVDDVSYITGAVSYIAEKYGINPNRVFGMGHSNGAMMTQRLMCETDLYAAAIPVSGPLEIHVKSCPGARGKSILAIHGADDKNVPVEGGNGTKGFSGVAYNSQAYTQEVYRASGANYQLNILPGADHNPKNINTALLKTEGITLPQKIVQFFGLDQAR